MDIESDSGYGVPLPDDVIAVRGYWSCFLAAGVLLIILGIVALGAPFFTALTIETLLGGVLVIGGIVHGLHAFRTREWRGFILGILSGVLYLIVGVLLLKNPLQGVLTLTLLVAAFFLVEGIFKVVLALQNRTMSGWVWLLFSGILALVLAGIIWTGWPVTGLWVIGVFVGIYLIFGGVSMVAFALAARNA
ncbi:MAG: HdeD family acid-resistance protein [Methanothrix sp.]|nr:MAG: HdeD family acid-resistance protein [Methanothrix sp.]